MMYTLPKFNSEKVPRSQTEHLQNLLWCVSGHGERRRCIEHVQQLVFGQLWVALLQPSWIL